MIFRCILLSTAAVTMMSCKAGQTDTTPGTSSQTTRTDTSSPRTAPATAPVYVDVRTADEYASGHVVGAINIPHDQMPARHVELAAYRDAPIVLYCASGRRSGIALEVLKQNGFTNATNGGGFDDVRAAGAPTE